MRVKTSSEERYTRKTRGKIVKKARDKDARERKLRSDDIERDSLALQKDTSALDLWFLIRKPLVTVAEKL